MTDDLIHMSPPPSAYGAQPFDVCEIDAHPDVDRLWATVVATRAHAVVTIDEIIERIAEPCFDTVVNDDGDITIQILETSTPDEISDALTALYHALGASINNAANKAMAAVLESAELDGHIDQASGEIIFTADNLPDGTADHIVDFIDRLAAVANRLTVGQE